MAKKAKHRNSISGPRQQQKDNGTQEAIFALERALIKEGDANRQQEGKEYKWSKLIEVVTLVFVICTTIGIAYQDYVLHRTDEAMHKSATAAAESAKAIREQLRADVRLNPPLFTTSIILAIEPLSMRLSPIGDRHAPAMLSGLSELV